MKTKIVEYAGRQYEIQLQPVITDSVAFNYDIEKLSQRRYIVARVPNPARPWAVYRCGKGWQDLVIQVRLKSKAVRVAKLLNVEYRESLDNPRAIKGL